MIEEIKIVVVNDKQDALTDLVKAAGGTTFKLKGTVDYVTSRVQEIIPDLIMINVGCVSGKYGISVCKAIKELRDTRCIPVVFVTPTNHSKEDKTEAFVYGCIDYIQSPFRDEDILERLQSYISLGKIDRNVRSLMSKLYP